LGPVRAAVKEPFRTALYGSVVFFVAALVLFEPVYRTNDDAVMNLIAAGVVLVDSPHEHLLYTNVLIGLPLKWLYTAAPHFPWYGWYLIGSLFLAGVGLAYALLSVNATGKQLLLVLLFFLAVLLPSVNVLQFTRVAFLDTLAGLFLLLACLSGSVPRVPASVAAAVLLVLGSLIRFEAFLLAGHFMAPAFVFTAWRVRDWAATRRVALVLVPAGLVCVALNWFNGFYYAHSPGWEEFYAFNTARAQVIDYARVTYSDRTRGAFDAVGWSAVDLEMMEHWFYADEQRYSLEKVRSLAAAMGVGDWDMRWRTPAVLKAKVLADPEVHYLLFIGICCTALMGAGGWSLALVGLEFALAAAVATGLHFAYYLPSHVLFPLATAPLAVAIFYARGSLSFWGTTWARRIGGALGAALLVAAVGLTVLACGWRWRLDQAVRKRNHDVMALIQRRHPGPDQLYVIWADCLEIHRLVSPLGDVRPLESFKCLHLSTTLRTPFARARLQQFGITDLCRALCERDDVFLVSNPYPRWNNVFDRYVKEHYGLQLDWKRIDHCGDPLRGEQPVVVYRVAAKDSGEPD
jgi:hypothetical protein